MYKTTKSGHTAQLYLTELKQIQEWFLITEEGIKNVREQHSLIGLESITIDDEHPPPEAMGCDLSSAQTLFTPAAWYKVQDACKCTFIMQLM